jgi:hypothetical protein
MEAWQVSRRLHANKTPDDAALIERTVARDVVCGRAFNNSLP